MHRWVRVFVGGVLALAMSLLLGPGNAAANESYAIAMHGAPALPPDFSHMPYANPGAPKGGRLVQGVHGTFDSLNPLIVRGLAVSRSGVLCWKASWQGATMKLSRYTACWQRASRRTTQGVTSPSISIRGRASPTASR